MLFLRERTKQNKKFESKNILWSFTSYPIWKIPFLEQLHLGSGKWNVIGYLLWYLNHLFLTHFLIISFYFIYSQARDKLFNCIKNEVSHVWRHIYDHMRGWYGCGYIPRGLWCFMKSAIFTNHLFTSKIIRVRGKCRYPLQRGRKFNNNNNNNNMLLYYLKYGACFFRWANIVW